VKRGRHQFTVLRPQLMCVHGLLVLDLDTGSLLYSHRLSLRYGLGAACEQLASDELRLSAMLFALHLNAAALRPESDGGAPSGATAPLSQFHLGGAALHFCASAERRLLLVLFADAGLGAACASLLATQLLRRFEARFAARLGEGGADFRSPRLAFKRQHFAADVLETLRAAPPWALRALAAGGRHDAACALPVAANDGAPPPLPPPPEPRRGAPPLALDELAALHSAALCEVLQRPPPAAPPAEFARRRGGGNGGGGGEASAALLLWGAVRAPHLADAAPPRRAVGCVPCGAAPGSARRPAPRPVAGGGADAPAAYLEGGGGGGLDRLLAQAQLAWRPRGRAVDAGALCATADGGGCRALLLRPPLVVSARARGADAADALAAAHVAAAAEPWLEPLGLLAAGVERLRPALERTAGAGAAAASRASG